MYGWNSTRVLHEERLKELSRQSTKNRGAWLTKIKQGVIRLYTLIFGRFAKAKRMPTVATYKTHPASEQQCI